MSGTGAMSGTWIPLAHLYLTTGPMAAVFCKDAGGSPASGTATATFSSPTEGAQLVVRRFAGARAAASQSGVTATGGTAGGAIGAVSITPGTTGSQVVGAFGDSTTGLTLTANGTTSIYQQQEGPSTQDTEAAMEASSQSTASTPISIGFTNSFGTSPTGHSTAFALVEILPAITGTGSLAVHKPSMSAAGAEVFTGTGSLAVHKPVLAASGTVIENAGTLAVHKPTFAGAGWASATGTGSLAVHKPSMSAAGVTIAGTGSVAVHKPGMAASGTEILTGTGSVAVRKPSVAGSEKEVFTGTGSVAVRKPSMAGTGATAPPFPFSPLDLRVELLLGGTWTDISSYVYQRDDMVITRGHPDESTVTVPASLAATLGNRDFRFQPANPLGAWYGLISRNTPIGVSVPEHATYLRLEDDDTSYAQAPDSAGLSITGDTEIRLDVTLDNWRGAQVLAWQVGGDGGSAVVAAGSWARRAS